MEINGLWKKTPLDRRIKLGLLADLLPQISPLIYQGLFSLQHRGQEGGMVVSDGIHAFL